MADSFHHSILVFDIEGFGRRNDLDQQWLRDRLRETLTRALAEAGVVRGGTGWQDTGDGGILLIPATVPKRLLIDPLMPRLHAALREHNTRASATGRLRLRIALHAGEVATDVGLDGRDGYVGRDLNLACRLVEAEPVRQALAEYGAAQFVLIVSAVIYDSVVLRGDGGIDPATYWPERVKVKEVDETAWVHILAGARSGVFPGRPLSEPSSTTFTPPATPADARLFTTGGNHLHGAVGAGRDANIGDRIDDHYRKGDNR